MKTEYPQNLDEATQIARTALPLAVKYQLPINPIVYALLYEYVLGDNTELKTKLDQLLNQAETTSTAPIIELYRKFLGDTDETALNAVRDSLLGLMASAQQSLSKLDEDSQSYTENLTTATHELESGGDLSSAANIVAKLIDDTAKMQTSSLALQNELSKTNNDLAELRTEFKRVQEESLVDQLTGIANRRAFDTALTEHCAESKATSNPLCLLLIDIDHFKQVNDTYGHVVGDAVLQRLARHLHNSVRGSDTLARYGGEEFVIILPETPMEGAEHVADTICNVVRNHPMDKNSVGDDVGRVTVSIGVALFHHGETEEEFVSRADTALYRAKESGRNRVCTHTV